MTRKINEAYKVIISCCNNYKYSFSKEEVGKYLTDEEWWFKRFGDDPLWGTPVVRENPEESGIFLFSLTLA